MEIPSGVIPAIRDMKDFEKALQSDFDCVVILETRLSQIKSLMKYIRAADKNVLIHFDLIQGLKTDEYGMEYVLREVKPDGVLSTRGNVIKLAKKNGLIAIQRMFLLDSMALNHNLKLAERFKPDCVEVLPGVIPRVIQEIHDKTQIPIIAGGLIRTKEDVDAALEAGARAVTTSRTELWE